MRISWAVSTGLILLVCVACRQSARGPLAARVNGQALSMADLDLEARLQNPAAIERASLLEDLIDLQLLTQEAARLSISLPASQREAQLQLAMAGTSEKEFEASLLARGLKEDQWRARVERQALADEVVRREVRGRVEISRQDIKDYYWVHVPEFRSPEQRRVRQVFTADKALAERALKELQLGDDFSEVAARHGQGPEAAKGGDLGWVSRGALPEALAGVVFKMKPGRVSGLMRSAWGWHLFMVEGQKSPKQQSLDQAAPRIHALLTRKREQPLYQAYLGALRERAVIERWLPAPTPAMAR